MRWLKQQLRQRMRERRRLLSPLMQKSCASGIAKQLFKQAFYQQAQHIALYLAFEGEVSTLPILKMALQHHKCCYVPILVKPYLQFVKIDLHTKMIKNRLGILEPAEKLATLSPRALDVVFMPLVAFDKHCHRLGMGAGYYDKTFSFRKRTLKPRLVGLAYDFQRVSYVPHGELDLRLNEVITEKCFYLSD